MVTRRDFLSMLAGCQMASLLPEQRAVLQELVKRGLLIPSGSPKDWSTDPLGFAREVLGNSLWEKQQQIMEAVRDHRRVAVRSCHHSGKTFTASAITQWFARSFNPSLVLTTAPTERQVEKLLWGEIAFQQSRARLPGKMLTTSLEVGPAQRAYGFTTNKPEKFQGWHCENILIIVDEASGVDEAIYEAIEGCLTGPNAKLLLIGNPNSPSGSFYEAFKSPLYEKFHISAYDVPDSLLPGAWAEERREEWGEESPAYRVRVLGEFPDEGDDTLFPLSWVERAQEAELEQKDSDVEIGVDVARYGGDESVAYVRCGWSVIGFDGWRGNDTQSSAGRVAALARRFAARRIKVDEIGVGAGVLDRLRSDGLPAIGINVGTSPRDKEKYQMLRDELFFGLRKRFQDGEISIPKEDTILLSQLTALKYGYLPTGKLKVESKDDMRKRRGTAKGWTSPDRADALALAFALPPPTPFVYHSAGRARPAF